jgi:hypothetical protein
MPRRWWGRSVGPSIMVLAVLGMAVRGWTIGGTEPALVIRGPDGSVLAEVSVPDGRFTLRYRNSLYRTLADEHYVIQPDGAIVLVGLAAEQLAVLEEYYAIEMPARAISADRMRWHAEPAREVVIDDLVVAATDRGERTLRVAGAEPMLLTALVDDRRPSVTLAARDS